MDRPKSKRQASPDVVQGLTVRAHSHGTTMQYSMKAIAQLATITEVIALSERAYDLELCDRFCANRQWPLFCDSRPLLSDHFLSEP
jgi:hypothetical protein